MVKSFQSRLEKFEDRLYSQHIKVRQEVYEYYATQKIVRFLCQINDGEEFTCAILSAGKEGRYIIVSEELRKRNQLIVGDELTIRLQPDMSKYGMPMPPELNEVLYQEPQFQLYFDELTPGKQRALIHLVSKLKSPHKRIEKAIIISQHLLEVQGRLDFKMLNEAFKKGV